MEARANINIPKEKIVEFCEKKTIFGNYLFSVLHSVTTSASIVM